jgi:hypothetical protein
MGRIKGYAPHHIAIYDNPEVEYRDPYHRGRKGGLYEGIVYGLKYECVEFARRYYIKVFGVTFDDVNNAEDIFKLRNAIDIRTKKKIPFLHINSLTEQPQPGDLLIWKRSKPYSEYGHVAIVIQSNSPSMATIAEQNEDTPNGIRRVNIHRPGIMGWMRLIPSNK